MWRMSKDLTREERLAAQLRANLRRRKAQQRGLSARGEEAKPDLSNKADEG